LGTIERAPLVAPKRRIGLLNIAVPLLVLLVVSTFLFLRKRAESAREEARIAAEKTSAEKMRPVYQAGKEIDAATSVGVNRLRFSELLVKLSAEVGILHDHASAPKEKRAADLYSAVLATYEDSSVVWNATTGDPDPNRPFDPPLAPIWPKVTPRECAAVERRGLPVHVGHVGLEDSQIVRGSAGMDWDRLGIASIDPKECVMEVWAQASKQLRTAEAEVITPGAASSP
jgi:hypothetical protein